MQRSVEYIIALSLIFLVGFCMGQERQVRDFKVKYVSVEAIYIDAGRKVGLAVGDTVEVFRGNRLVARLEVSHVSSQSAACRVIEEKATVVSGDIVRLFGNRTFSAGQQQGVKQSPQLASTGRVTGRLRRMTNHIRGSVSLQNNWQQDMTGRSMSSIQPSLAGRLTVENLFGTGLVFKMRHRSRLYYRSTGNSLAQDDWVHNLFECALTYGVPTSGVELGLGRLLSPYVRGMGYIDGVHIAARVHSNFRVGVAAGTQPREKNMSVTGSRQKYGAFMNFETGSNRGMQLSSTMAFSGSYENGMIDREFFYLQNYYKLADRLSIYQSVEIDINRKWRREMEGHDYTFSNLYVNANLEILSNVSANFSYDARKNVRTYRYYSVSDSLFDDTLRRGFSAGLHIRLSRNMNIRGTGSIRYREGEGRNNYFGSFSYQIRRFPRRGNSLSARMAYVKTQFTRGYRPTLAFRMPVKRRVVLNLTGGGYIYETGGMTTSNYFGEARAYCYFARKFHLSAAYRQYIDSRLRSALLSTELGMVF